MGEENSNVNALVTTVGTPPSPKSLSESSSSSDESVESKRSSSKAEITKYGENDRENCETESINVIYDQLYKDFRKFGKRKNELECNLKNAEREKISFMEDLCCHLL